MKRLFFDATYFASCTGGNLAPQRFSPAPQPPMNSCPCLRTLETFLVQSRIQGVTRERSLQPLRSGELDLVRIER